MATALVTGGAGFIGSYVAENLLRVGHTVFIIDDLSGGYIHNLPSGARFFCLSITARRQLHAWFRTHRPDYIFHLAAYAAEGLSPFIRHFNYTNNVLGSINLINEAINHQVQRFVFTSSVAVYGRQPVPFTEDLIPQPIDPYGIAKYAVEQDLHVAAEMHGLPVTIFRPHSVYGPRQNLLDRYRNVIAIFMQQVRNGRPMTIFGDGRQVRAFSYVTQVAHVIAECINMPETVGQTFNVGDDSAVSINRVATLVAKALEMPKHVIHVPARHEAFTAYCDHSKLRKYFGNLSSPTLADGIREMAEWATTTFVHSPPPAAHPIEISRGLPEVWQ